MDPILLYWRGADGDLVEMTVDIDDAARLDRGELVIGRGLVERFSPRQLAAQKSLAHDRLAAVEAERADLLWRHGGSDFLAGE